MKFANLNRLSKYV